ncbi:Transcription factor UPBEAT1, partial [Cucurbita argyrosperma subsp. sororia]
MRSIHSFRQRRQATSTANLKPTRRRRLKLVHLPKNTTSSSAISAAATGTTPSPAMHKRLRNLQRLVPGHNHDTDLNHLFQRTADYIQALQLKLNILKDLTSFYGL